MKNSVGPPGTPHRSLFWRSCYHHTYCATRMDLAVKGPALWLLKKLPYPSSPPTAGSENDEVRQWMDAFSEFERLHWSCWAIDHWPVYPVGGSFFCVELDLKLCLSLECWCSSLIAHVYVTSAFHGVPSFILFSWSHIWVFPTFIFNMDLLQNLLIFKRDIIKSWTSPWLRTPALLLSCWCYLSKATWCLTAASVMVRARGSGAGYNSGVIWLWDLVWVI